MSKRSPNQVRTVRGFKRVVKLVPITKTIITAGPVYVAFGEAVREARTTANLRQEDLGVKVGLSRPSIINIEQGRQRVMLDDLFIFAKALGVKPSKFFNAIRNKAHG